MFCVITSRHHKLQTVASELCSEEAKPNFKYTRQKQLRVNVVGVENSVYTINARLNEKHLQKETSGSISKKPNLIVYRP